MIIGYYHSIFFGGGTYFKLSKKENDIQYKFEYCHQAIPNRIPKAEKFIRKYDTLEIEDERFKEKFKGKIIEKYLEYNSDIEAIMNIIDNTDWKYIASQEYSSENFDDVCWNFYIEDDNVLIDGYSIYPREIKNILQIFYEMKEKYMKEVENND